MLSKEKQMDVLEAYDLTNSPRAAAQLTGTDHHTVARYVAARAAGTTDEDGRRAAKARATASPTRSPSGSIARRARCAVDVVHERLVAMGLHRLGTDHPPSGGHPQGPPIATPTTASTSPGSPNPGSGSNTTLATSPSNTKIYEVHEGQRRIA